MGSHQENWFYRKLSESKERGATWRLVGNQLIFSRIEDASRKGDKFSGDTWDVSTWSRFDLQIPLD
jgi:alkaline phosphatase D